MSSLYDTSLLGTCTQSYGIYWAY